jgi:hypothetical protein
MLIIKLKNSLYELVSFSDSFYVETLRKIETNARLAYDKLMSVPGLKPVMPELSNFNFK